MPKIIQLFNSDLNSEIVKNNFITAFLCNPLNANEQLDNEQKLRIIIASVDEENKNDVVHPPKKVRVLQSNRMCLIQKNQAGNSETTAARSDSSMSPVSKEATKKDPSLTTRYLGRNSTGTIKRAYKRRMVPQGTTLPEQKNTGVTAATVIASEVSKPIESPGPPSLTDSSKNDFLTTDKAYPLLDYKQLQYTQESDNTHNRIDVPSWTVNPLKSSSKLEKTENINDDVFVRRHKKCETDEHRSKKWDSRRLREQISTEKQKNKQSQKHKNTIPRKSKSFYPDLKNVEFLEITEELPVLAFGEPIPYFQPSEFSLPWQAEGVSEASKAKRGRPSVT